MNTQLVEIQPRELKFIFEVKKQISCGVHLANITDQYVAFKVKTTSPKKYCVRPNVGVIKPKSTHDFTVTMQAQKSAFLEMQCKDKFLIQSTVVSYGTTEEEIIPSMFARDSQKYIEETKLRVVLTSAPNSPVSPPATAVLKQEAPYENLIPMESYSPVLLPVNGIIKQEQSHQNSTPKDKLQNGVENLPPPDALFKKVETVKNVKNLEDSRSLQVMENMKSVPVKDEFYPTRAEETYPTKDEKSNQVKNVEEEKVKLTKDVEELRSKITALDSKLLEAMYTIEKLNKEKSNSICLKQELIISRTKGVARKIQFQDGFPPLFVCMVALISMMIGWLF